ncbi:MAG TPA: hypothetical protein PK047_12455 [Saprospiraceae bacterium]|nr:hypothetical protein [Saprospiraceae bacterium]HRP42954.1 hypothetical protein [Saprospiraceae bacterium]
MKTNFYYYFLTAFSMFALIFISCNRDEISKDNSNNQLSVESRNIAYCDGQIERGITIDSSYIDPNTGQCCLTFKFEPQLNACWARLEYGIVTQVITTPPSYYTPIVDNKVTFCKDYPFEAQNNLVIYFKECTGYGSGCMDLGKSEEIICN